MTSKFFKRRSRRLRRRSRINHPSFETLESRRLLAVVNSVDDCSGDNNTCLGEALLFAAENERITFSLPAGTVIKGKFSVPTPVVIDGENSGVVLEGNSDIYPLGVLDLEAGGTTVRGLTIRPDPSAVLHGASWVGIHIRRGSNNNVIEGNFIGTNPGGMDAPEVGTFNTTGIYIRESAGDVIKGNVISVPHSANPKTDFLMDSRTFFNSAGISIRGATGTTIQGNKIGTNAAGTQALGNGAGIDIGGGSNIKIGGDIDRNDERNVISGNTVGILLRRRDFFRDNTTGSASSNELVAPPTRPTVMLRWQMERACS